jgi:enoyl-CoA hydratase/carnithine racemase
MGYLLTGARITPQVALDLGLLNEVVPADALTGAVRRWCEEILALAPLSIQATKEAAMRGLGEPDLASALRNQKNYPGYQRWWLSEDRQEGTRAFAEKRPASWRGR